MARLEKARQVFTGETDYWKIDENSLMYGAYRWWQAQTGAEPKKLQNFCYYFWLTVVVMPLLWFFIAPFYKWVRPWMVVFAVVWIGLVLKYELVRGITAVVVLIGAVIVGCIGLVIGGMVLIQKYFADQLEKYILMPMKFFWNYGMVPAWTWFVHAHIARVIYPWSVLLVAIFGWFVYLLGFKTVAIATIGVVGFIGIVATVVIGAAWIVTGIGRWFDDHREQKRAQASRRQPISAPQRHEKGLGTPGQLVAYVKAKKRRICPIIVLPGQDWMIEK